MAISIVQKVDTFLDADRLYREAHERTKTLKAARDKAAADVLEHLPTHGSTLDGTLGAAERFDRAEIDKALTDKKGQPTKMVKVLEKFGLWKQLTKTVLDVKAAKKAMKADPKLDAAVPLILRPTVRALGATCDDEEE